MAPKTIMRGAGTEDSINSVSGAPQREPCSPISSVPVRPASRKAPASAATVRSSSGWAPKPPVWEPSGRTTSARPVSSAGPLTIRATAAASSRGDGERGGEDRTGGVVRPYRGDEDVDDAAAGQAHGEGVLVAVAEALQDGFAVVQRLPAQLVHGPLHTAAGDRADRRAVGVHREGGAGLAGALPPTATTVATAKSRPCSTHRFSSSAMSSICRSPHRAVIWKGFPWQRLVTPSQLSIGLRAK